MTLCRVEKRIWRDADRASDYTCLFYELDVGDAPERGSELHEGRWFSGPLTQVLWNVDDGFFHCRVDDELPCADCTFDYDHGFLVDNAVQEGWRICEGWEH